MVLLTHALSPGEPAFTQLPLHGAPPSSNCNAAILKAQARCHLLPEAHPAPPQPQSRGRTLQGGDCCLLYVLFTRGSLSGLG